MISITFHYRYRKQIILGVLLFVMVGALTGFTIYKIRNKKEKETIIVKKKETLEVKKEVKIETYKIDIKGEIMVPGIYDIEKDKRVMDVIAKAGGLTENADTSVINLSKKVQDEMVIIIYSREEVADFKKTKELEKNVQEKCIQKEENALRNDACITQNQQISGKISINTGTIEELMTLPGIGEAKAKEIIAYREEHGPFQSIEEIMNISGIGESRYAALKEAITVD